MCTELRQINPFHDVHFCKSLLSGYSFYSLSRLQNVQSSAVKLVFRVHKGNRGLSLIQALCWLLVQARIDCQPSVTTSSMPHLLPISLTFSPYTPLPDSLVLLQTREYVVFYPMLKLKPLANALSVTVLQSNGIISPLISVTFSFPMHSKPQL